MMIHPSYYDACDVSCDVIYYVIAVRARRMVRSFFYHISVTVQNRTHVHMNFFCLESHIQSFPKVLQIPPESPLCTYTCTCVDVCVSMSVYMYSIYVFNVCVFTYIYEQLCISECMYLLIDVYNMYHVCLRVYIHIYIYVRVYEFVCVYDVSVCAF